MSRTWRVRLTQQAETDFFEISRWTAENFGALQAESYVQTVMLAIEALNGGPEVLGTRARDEIAKGVRTLHVARKGRKGRHFVVFRAAEGQIVEVLRLLHDSMDLARHVPSADDQPH